MLRVLFIYNNTNIFQTALHEGVGEFLQAHNKKGYEKISTMLLNYWAKTNSDELAKRIRKYQKAYGNKYRESANELVNDTLAEIFANEKAMRDMAAWMATNESKANAKTIKQVITDYIQTIKDIIADIKNLKKQGLTYDSRLKFTDEECDKLMKAITTAMDEGIASRDRVAGENNQTKVSEEARNALEVSFMKNLSEEDRQNYREFKRNVIALERNNFKTTDSVPVMAYTPEILQLIGLDDKPIYASSKHIKKALSEYNEKKHTHGLSEQDVFEIPILLNNPVMIADSISDDAKSSIVIISESLDFDKRPIILAIKSDGEGRTNLMPVESNFLTSFYGKDKFGNFLDNVGRNNAMLYMDKEKTQALLSGLRLQLPSSLTNLVFDDIIHPSKNIVNRESVSVDYEKYLPVAEKLAALYSDFDYYDYFDAAYQSSDIAIDMAMQLANGDYSILDNLDEIYDDLEEDGQKLADEIREELEADRKNASRNYLDIDVNKEVSSILDDNSAKGRNSIGVDTPVSANDDLVAVHNMMPKELLQTLKLGGFPSPSIAVIRANMEHSKYGTVSIVFGRDTIDPKKKAANKVYGGDAWTPTFPTIEYQANENTLRKVVKYLEDNVPTQILSAEGYMGLDADNAEDYLNRNGGDIKRSYENKLPMMYAFYTASDGLGKTILEFPTRQVSLSKFPDASYARVAELLGADLVDAKQDSSYYTSHPEIVEQLLNIVNEEKWLNFSKDKEGLSKRSEEVIEKYKHFYDKLSFSDFDKLINATSQYVDNNYQLPTEIDYYVLKDALKEEISDHKDAYEKWLDNLFEGIVEREGIYNNKDFYTPSGNRRSWEALHMPVTLENIVKAMNFRDAKGDALFSQSAIQAIATKDFKSIDDIKKNINMLQMLSDEEYKDISDRLYERYKEVSNKLLPEDATWEEMDRVAYLISDTIRTKKTAPAIYKELHKYNQLATPEIAQEIVDLMDDISNRATGYFEAKPQRAVYLDEILKAVVPSDATELIEELKAQKIPFETYELGDEEARTKAVNDTEGGRFSISVDADSAESEPHYLSEVLSPQEYNQVKSWIDSKKQPSFIAKNGDKVLRLDNKLVYTDGEENIGISKIIATNTELLDDYDINTVLDIFTDAERRENQYESARKTIENIFGQGVCTEYNASDFGEVQRYDRPTERGKSISDAYHAARQQNGARVYLKDGEIVRKSLEVDDRYEIKLGDASPYADSISEMYVISSIFSRAKNAVRSTIWLCLSSVCFLP